MATKKTATKPALKLVEKEPATAATKETKARTSRPKRAQAAPSAEPEPEAKEPRPAAQRAKGAAKDGGAKEPAKRQKKEAEPEPAQEQPSEQLPEEPAPEPTAKKKVSRKRARLASAADDAPWNPTVALRWDDEEQPAWTGTLDEMIEANTLDEGGDAWVEELKTALRQSGQHQGGGGAAPSYSVGVLKDEFAKPDPDQVRARVLAGLPKPPDTRPANVTSATLLHAATGFLAELEAEGASEATVSGYRRELKVALDHFGEDALLCALTPRKVQNYFECDAVMVARNGQPKAEPSWQRTRRVLRLSLRWAAEQGLVEEAPLPEKRRASKKQQGAASS